MKLRYFWVDRDDRRGAVFDLYFDEEYGLTAAEVPDFPAWDDGGNFDQWLQGWITENLREERARDGEDHVITSQPHGEEYTATVRWQLIPESDEERRYLDDHFDKPSFPIYSADDLNVFLDQALDQGRFTHPHGWEINAGDLVAISDRAPVQLLELIGQRGLKGVRGHVRQPNPELKRRLMR